MRQLKSRKLPNNTNIVISPGVFYAPYIPLQFSDRFMLTCELCGAPADRRVNMNTPRGYRDIEVCQSCELRHDIKQYLFVFEHDKLFPENHPRECDNIVWHIAAGRPIYPLTVYTDQHGVAVGVSKRSTILTRDYRCHDSLLYEATEFPTSRLIGQPPYAYRFPKAIYDGTNYMIGFMADGNHLTAESVEFDDAGFEYDDDPA